MFVCARQARAVHSIHHEMSIITLGCCLARRDTDTVSWWMTGKKECLYFLILFKSTIHGQVRLQKMAGDMQEERMAFGV